MGITFRKFSVWRLWRHCLESLGLMALLFILERTVIKKKCTKLSKLKHRTGA
jgi:hypothetical protein